MRISEERYSPGAFDLCTGYEHVHRYLFAAEFVQGKKVLDLACGEGYGAAWLARSASEVIGVDICPDAVDHASAKYRGNNLSFRAGSMTSVPLDELFDVIVCFEAIEHIRDHDLLCKEAKRLLKPSGVFIVSTPNKWVYSENGISRNPYHLKELDLGELQTLLSPYFKHTYVYGQKTVASSRISPLHSRSNEARETRMRMDNEGFCLTDEEDPMPRYFIALASDQTMETYEGASYLTDVAARDGFAQWAIPAKPSRIRLALMKCLAALRRL